MTNIISIWLGLLFVGFFAVDYFLFDWQMLVFLARKLMDMIEYIAIWR